MTVATSNIISKVITLYLNGYTRDKIAQSLKISAGTTSNIINDWKNKIQIPDIVELRKFSVEINRKGISLDQCAQGYRLVQLLNNLGISTDEDYNDINFYNNDNNNTDFLYESKEPYAYHFNDDDNLLIINNNFDNTNINIKRGKKRKNNYYNKFETFINKIFINCEKHGITVDILFSWFDDLLHFIPSNSHSINYSTNNSGNPISFNSLRQDIQASELKVPLTSRVSSFIDQKKKECTLLEYDKKDLEKEIKNLGTERDNLYFELELLEQDCNHAKEYSKWFYRLKKELWYRYSIGMDDFERFTQVINDFRNLGYDAPKIIEKYLKVNSIEKEINIQLECLSTLQVQIKRHEITLSNLQSKINQYHNNIDFINKVKR